MHPCDTETVGLGAQHRPPARRYRLGIVVHVSLPLRWCGSDPELLQPALEMCPELVGLLTWRTLGIGLVGAQEDVPLHPRDGEGFGDLCQSLLGFHFSKLSHPDTVARNDSPDQDSSRDRVEISGRMRRGKCDLEPARGVGVDQRLYQVDVVRCVQIGLQGIEIAL